MINKLLVLTYNKSEFRLILAHYHLGQAYLLHECVDQAVEHVSLALHKIEKFFEEIPEMRFMQNIMQSSLAKALIKKENFDDAIELLNEVIRREKEQRESEGDNDYEEENASALTLLAQCYAKIKDC